MHYRGDSRGLAATRGDGNRMDLVPMSTSTALNRWDEEVKLREAELALMQRLAAAGDRGDAAASAELE